jgi:hypothetical protein
LRSITLSIADADNAWRFVVGHNELDDIIKSQESSSRVLQNLGPAFSATGHTECDTNIKTSSEKTSQVNLTDFYLVVCPTDPSQ